MTLCIIQAQKCGFWEGGFPLPSSPPNPSRDAQGESTGTKTERGNKRKEFKDDLAVPSKRSRRFEMSAILLLWQILLVSLPLFSFPEEQRGLDLVASAVLLSRSRVWGCRLGAGQALQGFGEAACPALRL